MLTKFRPNILSRHPSHSFLRRKNKSLPLFPFRSIVRFGSTTETSVLNSKFNKTNTYVELNTVEAIKNSSSKLKMKKCFADNNVKTAKWWRFLSNDFYENGDVSKKIDINELPYPIIAKSNFGSRGLGNTKINNNLELDTFLNSKDRSNYLFEKYYNYSKEYRLHVSENGCFYTCRKALKSDCPSEAKWFRNDSNCVWFMENNANFNKPNNWDSVVEESVKALKAVGLDFGAIDLRIQSIDDPDFIIVEINSAPSFGSVTIEKYKEEITKLLIDKYNKNA